jgi:hypothetical protein
MGWIVVMDISTVATAPFLRWLDEAITVRDRLLAKALVLLISILKNLYFVIIYIYFHLLTALNEIDTIELEAIGEYYERQGDVTSF